MGKKRKKPCRRAITDSHTKKKLCKPPNPTKVKEFRNRPPGPGNKKMDKLVRNPDPEHKTGTCRTPVTTIGPPTNFDGGFPLNKTGMVPTTKTKGREGRPPIDKKLPVKKTRGPNHEKIAE